MRNLKVENNEGSASETISDLENSENSIFDIENIDNNIEDSDYNNNEETNENAKKVDDVQYLNAPIRIILSKCIACDNFVQKGQDLCNLCNTRQYRGALMEIENHRGIAEKEEQEERQKVTTGKRKRNKYLGGGFKTISDQLLFSNNRKNLPILRNGCSNKLGFTLIDNRKYFFSNTCAFDSLFSVVLAATVESDIFKKEIIDNYDNSFFKVLKYIYTMKNFKVNTKVYQLRGACILEYKQSIFSNNFSTPPSDVIQINSFTHIANLASFIFKDYPSVIIHLTCEENPTHFKLKQTLPIYLISIENLLNAELFYNIIEQKMLIQFCRKCRSRAEITTLITGNVFKKLSCNFSLFIRFFYYLGTVVCFELCSKVESELNISLKNIPTKFKGLDDNIYLLTGAIEYSGPDIMNEKSDIGHYTALRFSSTWTRYDDLLDTPTSVKSTEKFRIKLLFYVKVSS